MPLLLYVWRIADSTNFFWWKVSTWQHTLCHLLPSPLADIDTYIWSTREGFVRTWVLLNDRFMENACNWIHFPLMRCNFQGELRDLPRSSRNLPCSSCKLGPFGKHFLLKKVWSFKVLCALSTGMLKKSSEKRSWAVSWSVSVIRPSDTYCLIGGSWFTLSNLLQSYALIMFFSFRNEPHYNNSACFWIQFWLLAKHSLYT